MECNSKVYSLIKKITREQKIQFGIFSIRRVVGIYEQFEKSEDSEIVNTEIPQGERYNLLISIIKYLQDNKEYDKDKIKHYIDLLESLVTDDEDDGNSTGLTIAGYVITGTIAVLEFIQNDDVKRIFWCSDSIIEIMNQVKSEEYYSKYPDYSDDEIEKLVDASIDDEVKIEKEIITMIQSDLGMEELEQYIEKNLVNVPDEIF